uniref:ORF 1 n=1 Tax=Desulfurococcus mucosus TaxID=2275 RepID=Q46510_DESMO|nr:unnamed protein product [Desulfurococcus mucosus]
MGVLDYFSMMRIPNSLMSGVGAVFMSLMFSNYCVDCLGVVRLAAGFATGFTVTAASMLVNDVVDLGVDRVNKPWKPLPSGRASPRVALALSIFLPLIALAVNLSVDKGLALVTVVYSALGLGYSFLRKHWWSQLIVAASTTGPIAYGYVAAGSPSSSIHVALGLSITIFVVTLGREVLKAMQDVEGDRLHGYSTIPLKLGVEESAKLLVFAGIAGPAAGITTGVIAGSGIVYKAVISVAGGLYLYSMVKAYRKPREKNVLEEARKETLLEMMLGLVAFWMFRV